MENYKNSKIGRETAQKYRDILEMERPQTEESLRKHPPHDPSEVSWMNACMRLKSLSATSRS